MGDAVVSASLASSASMDLLWEALRWVSAASSGCLGMLMGWLWPVARPSSSCAL